MDEWQRLRRSQVTGQPYEIEPLASAMLADDLPMHDWQRDRKRQVDGLFRPLADLRLMRMTALASPADRRATGQTRLPPPSSGVTPPKGPLTGRPGVAAVVAGALNVIASGPNTSAPVRLKGVDGVVRRGAGRDVSAEGTVRVPNIPIQVNIRAGGMLDPPSGRGEVVVSNPRGRSTLGTVQLPERVRFYNTPSGELDVHLPTDIKVGRFVIRPAGDYYIGRPDPPRRR